MAGITYEVALRAIGQDLMASLLDSVEIATEGQDFVARANRETLPENRESFFDKAWQKLRSLSPWGGAVQKSVSEPFARRYTPQDIHRLDKLGLSRRTRISKVPDILSLAESLRTIGRVVDSNEGHLIRLAKSRTRITFEYEDVNGVTHTEELYGSSLYRTQQEGLSLRGKEEKKDPWEGRDL